MKGEAEILQDAVDLWGSESQICMAAEEAGELITALMKFGRRRNGTTAEEVIDEIADVYVMLKQLELIFDDERIKDRYQYKLRRLKERIYDWKETERAWSVKK